MQDCRGKPTLEETGVLCGFQTKRCRSVGSSLKKRGNKEAGRSAIVAERNQRGKPTLLHRPV
jgi:hypothetical protein